MIGTTQIVFHPVPLLGRILISCHMAEDIWQNIPYITKENSVFERGWPTYPTSWNNEELNQHIANLRTLRVEINKAIEGCRTKQIIGAALETEVKEKEAHVCIFDGCERGKRGYSDYCRKHKAIGKIVEGKIAREKALNVDKEVKVPTKGKKGYWTDSHFTLRKFTAVLVLKEQDMELI